MACPGMLWAGGILLAWLFSLPPLLAIDGAFIERRLLTPLVAGSAAWLPPSLATGVSWFLVGLLAALAVLLRSFLHTGLFIVAHDAMHGVLHRGSARANARLGQLALLLYAGLSYGRCLRQHQRHHRHHGTASDPDFAGGGASLGRWFLKFLASYLGWAPMTKLLTIWAVLFGLASRSNPTAAINLLLFSILPLLLSSLQLFLFGTYLPHRPAAHRAGQTVRSLPLPGWLSLLACYHFGYHWEHHAYPWLAWHELPASRSQATGDRVPARHPMPQHRLC